jgi:Ni/Co efflux regulator RcnB
MKRLTITLAVAALALGSMALSASAQNQQRGAASLGSQAQNATPIHQAACRGFGRHCGPGFHWVCGPARCWCAPC